MKMIDPSVDVTFFVPEDGSTPEEAIEKAARNCYKSEGKIKKGSAAKLIKKLVKRGHHAMLEFGFAMAHVVGDRGNCYDDQTEVYTRSGWKLFKYTSDEDEFFTLNIEKDHFVEFQKRTAYVEKEWDGELIYGLSSKVDFAVTPDHRMLLCDHNSLTIDDWGVDKAAEIENRVVRFQCGVLPNTDCHVFHKENWSRRHYKGKVYCVTVPNGLLYVRRNGKALWSGNSHEQVRHRLASYAQESTRYCNYSKDKFGTEITLINQPFKKETSHAKYRKIGEQCEAAYLELLVDGEDPQLARACLPIGLKAEIVVGANLREWRHIFKMRCDSAAHPIIRGIMTELFGKFYKKMPSVYEDQAERFLEGEGSNG